MWKFFTKSGQEKVQDTGYLPVCNVIYDKVLTSAEAGFDVPIPPGYTHLKILCHLRGDDAGVNGVANIRFNGDAGAVYDYERIVAGPGTTLVSATGEGATSAPVGYFAAAGSIASQASPIEITIPNFSSSTFFKSGVAADFLRTTAAGGQQYTQRIGFQWRNLAPMTSLRIYAGAGLFIPGSRVTVYAYSVVPLPSPGAALPVTYGTALPSSPLDGQEAILVDSLTAPTYLWRFRRNTAAGRWEWVGGRDIRVQDGASRFQPTLATFEELGTIMRIPIVYAGLYQIHWGIGLDRPATTGSQAQSFLATTVATPLTPTVGFYANDAIRYIVEGMSRVDELTLAASDILRMTHRSYVAQGEYYSRFMSLKPLYLTP